ncbi:MAG: MarC family protein, partial [Verrucomicrobiota bacterium]|nr:MarC family protein [Verrucomicrobiota bacterium]
MQDFWHKFLVGFIPVFVAVDAIGLVAIFLGLSGSVDSQRRQSEGTLALITALAVSIVFIFLGKVIFAALGITVGDFQVAGGLILLGIAVRELLDLGDEKRPAGQAFGVVPLGMPLIAGPALLTSLLVLVDSVGIIYTLVSLLLNLLIVGLAFRNADMLT